MKIKAIRPNSKWAPSADYIEFSNKKIQSYASPGTEITITFPDAPPTVGGGGGPLSEARTQGIVPYVLEEAVKAEEEGFDGVLMMGEYNVGSEVAKHMVKLPIIDSGTAILHVAAMVGDRICVLVPEDDVKAYARRLFKRWGMNDFVTSLKSWGIPLHEAWAKKEGIKEKTISMCKTAVQEEDAQVILPFCGPFVPFIVSPEEIEAEVGVPVINTVATAVKMIEVFVTLGIRPSRKVYPFFSLK